MPHTPAATLLTAITALASGLIAQNRTVVMTEIRADGADRWVELQNRGSVAADLGGWTLYYATATAGQPQTYFFGFQSGTQIDAGAHLLVHWCQPRPSVQPANEVWTGDSPYNFLFSLGAEPLLGTGGALALIRSQSNQEMSVPAMFEDWVSWGRSGLSRENLAVQAGLWQTNTFADALTAGCSLSRNETLIGTAATPAGEWFVDPTPTPLQTNVPGVLLSSLGAACTTVGNHLFGLPTLTPISSPVIGNREFGLSLANTSGILFETVLLAYAARPAPAGMPQLLPPTSGGPTCALLFDYQSVFTLQWLRTAPLQTPIPLNLQHVPATLAGLQFVVQAMVFDGYSSYPPYQGVSNAVQVRLGG